MASDQIDVEFVVPQTHRLRFTTDVFGEDRDVLAAVLESSDGQAVRVQFWVDQHVADATPDLLDKIIASLIVTRTVLSVWAVFSS